MKKHLVAAGVAMVASLLVAPTAALGAMVPGTEGGFVALSERDSGGQIVSVPIRAGETVPVTVGVAYNGNVSPAPPTTPASRSPGRPPPAQP